MHAFLIVGGNERERAKKARERIEEYVVSNPQVLTGEKSHTISDMRNLIRSFRFKGVEGKKRGVVLENAHNMTQEAANAFLKTLEEPPGDTIIILTAPNKEVVAETIASRCEVIDLGAQKMTLSAEEEKENRKTFTKLMAWGMGDKFALVDKLGVREQAVNFIIGQTIAARLAMLEQVKKGRDVTQLALLLDSLETARLDLAANVNTKLVLTELFLSYPSGLDLYTSEV